MIPSRLSPGARRNKHVEELPRKAKDTNVRWWERARGALDMSRPGVVLLGGTGLTDFRVRVAQSHARVDMQPSFWSHVALLLPSASGKSVKMWHVPLDTGGRLNELPASNAITTCSWNAFADVDAYPNVAVLQFPGAGRKEVQESVGLLRMGRLFDDLITPLVQWLGFVWGARGEGNPLLHGHPLPAAAFAEAAFGNAGVDITPGLSERTSCPEAIWQAALWWSEAYGTGGESSPPSGVYCVDQRAAAAAG